MKQSIKFHNVIQSKQFSVSKGYAITFLHRLGQQDFVTFQYFPIPRPPSFVSFSLLVSPIAVLPT